VCLELADDGPGVSPERLPLICDPFFTTREQGRGLGLAVVVGILGAHRAGFHIFNGEGGGLVQRIHFPPSGL
jgi:C4-dicarboxylate-specific signal transduction histidine kinase